MLFLKRVNIIKEKDRGTDLDKTELNRHKNQCNMETLIESWIQKVRYEKHF